MLVLQEPPHQWISSLSPTAFLVAGGCHGPEGNEDKLQVWHGIRAIKEGKELILFITLLDIQKTSNGWASDDVAASFEREEMERRGGDRYDLRPLVRYSSMAGTLLEWDDDSEDNRGRRKKRKRSKHRGLNQWAELPEDILYVLSKRLSMVDYLSFSRVCTSWRSSSKAFRKDFLTSVSPFMIIMSSRGKKSCFFFNISDGARYKTKLHCRSQRFFLGVSSGYFVILPPGNLLSFTNPVTGHLLEVPRPPFPERRPEVREMAIIGSIIPQKDFIIVTLCQACNQIHFRRYRDAEWIALAYDRKERRKAVDVAVFKYKIYALFFDGHIGCFDLKSACITFLELEGRPESCSNNMKFVVGDERLLVVDFTPYKKLEIHEIDFLEMKWVKVTDLGDKALFLSTFRGIRLISPKKWGGPINCLYYLPSIGLRCELISLNCSIIDRIETGIEFPASYLRFNFGWFFPDQAYEMDVVWDDKHGDMPEQYTIE
ncbi:uncharacterized protein LOC110808977 isoform X2 [Carica papaya]|uniref:uncharacterized protein LOC110808977 isoform X2 n=1 Tax=Carica papaya TaxID=3649 RepID=UPI000B8CA27A|nr:uncharacterized protein LOC110808977 isoform X2 [Carica papaya]